MRVLLVDDDEGVLLTLAALLEDEGHGVSCAKTLAQARVELSAAPFDAVLLDLQIGAEPGTLLIPDVAQRSPQARIVMLSGASIDELPAGTHGAVLKGARVEEILALLAGA
ncbi:MAG: response regulator [Sandaracinaceae bacterium]|nr:response regulator [Sandaracinaceae bacterium]